MKRRHPIQEIRYDDNEVQRFVENKIVRFLLEEYKKTGRDLNNIYLQFGETEDYEQLMMLIGYSLSGMSDLGYHRTVAGARKKWIREDL